jgi:hypothetical protein
MRPPKTILLVGANEDAVSRLKFVLWTYHYDVTAAANADEAIRLLHAQSFDLLFCLLPLAGVESLLGFVDALDNGTHTLVQAPKLTDAPEGVFEALILPNYSREDLLIRVKILCARKRGPRPLKKPVVNISALVEPEIARLAS